MNEEENTLQPETTDEPNFKQMYDELKTNFDALNNRFNKYVDKQTKSEVKQEQEYQSIEDRRRNIAQEMEKIK